MNTLSGMDVEKQKDSITSTNSVLSTAVSSTSCNSMRCDSAMLPSVQNHGANERQRVNGEVVLTPTHSSFTPHTVNPHNTMAALTPMASGSSQARNSVKLQ